MDERPIGVFDSGVGGLTVAREIMRQLPSEHMVYFGDTARVPYGNKSKETIIKYSYDKECESHRGSLQYGNGSGIAGAAAGK